MPATKWFFTDPGDSSTLVFALNPAPGRAAGEVPLQVLVAEEAITQTGPVVNEKPQANTTSSFDVLTLTQADYQALWVWYEKDKVLTLTDDLGRVSTIFITGLVAKRERSATVQWKHVITVTYHVLALTDF